jgi:hypothetical protein
MKSTIQKYQKDNLLIKSKKSLQQFTKLVLLLTFFCQLNTAFAQAPQKMSYQAVVRNAANTLIANTAVGVKISVLQTTASGTVVYSERHTPTTNANGLATFEIGGGTVLSGTFASINWSNSPYFIKTETDPTGGTSYSISGTSQLASVPYALFAANGGTPGPQGIQGVPGATGTAGANGKNTLILTTTEPAGANCPTGGTRQQYGLDANGNNILEPAEINTALTKYVCNGLAGATGATGAQGPPGTATNAWGLTGTTGTTAANFIGTTDNTPLVIKTNNNQALKINENGRVDITSGVSGPYVSKLAVVGDTSMKGNSITNIDSFGTLSVTSTDPLGQDNDPIMALDGETIQTKGFDQQGSYANNLKINPNGGNIGIGNTGVIQNKLQIGNPPGFSGNDIAIGNGSQAMSLYQSPTASTFFTNTNFAFMPASGPANVGINTLTPSSKLEVDGSIANKFTLINADYTPTDADYIIYANKQFYDAAPLTITLPLPAFCRGRIYYIKALALPEIFSLFNNSDQRRMDFDVDSAYNSAYPPNLVNTGGSITINNHLNQPITYLHYFTAPNSIQSRTFICVQSIGTRWIVLSDNFFSDSN